MRGEAQPPQFPKWVVTHVRRKAVFVGAAALLASGISFLLQPSIQLPFAGATTSASRMVPLVSATTARSAAAQIFSLWQNDLHSGTRKLLQQVETGIQLSWDTYNCTTVQYIAHTDCPISPLLGLAVVVPKQYRYPLRMLAEVQTTEDTSAFTSSTIVNTPALELIVLTKATAAASWKISFVTSVYSTTQNPPPFLPAPTTSDGLAVQVTSEVQRGADVLPEKLAVYWHTWKDHDAPPDGTAFLPGPFTTSYGAALAREPDGVVGHDLRQHVTYSSQPSINGAFVFPVGFGEFTTNPTPGGIGYGGNSGVLVCSAIRVSITFTPQMGGSPLFQDKDEISFGPGLAPGYYSEVVNKSVHESCVLTDGHHLSVLGSDGNIYAQRGVPLSLGALNKRHHTTV
jgi:hypothetical protein